ncbi:hypothetical protein BJX99DRAFT_258297 [Aspergillus californicus]
MSNNTYPKNESWILFPKRQGVALYVSWRQNKVVRREKYFLVNCYWSPDKNFTGSPVGENWAMAKLDKRFQYGQDKAEPNTTFRWVVYHPPTWEPKQADFGQSAFTTIAADLMTSTAKSLTSTGLKIADPSGILNAGAANLVGWENAKKQLQSRMNSYGDPLRKFGQTGLTEVQEKQMAADKEEYQKALETAMSQVDGHPNTSHLGDDEKEVYYHVMVALNLGGQGVAEEGSHHASRPFVVNPSPFGT